MNLRKSIKERLFTILIYLSLIYGIYNCFVTDNWYLFGISFLIFLFHGVFGGNIALHRLYSHKNFSTGKLREYFLLMESVLAGAGIGPITWAAVHRAHHANSDKQPDPHSPYIYHPLVIGLGLHYFISDKKRKESNIKLPVDLYRKPELRFIETHYHLIWVSLIIIVWVLFSFDNMIYYLLLPAGIYNIYSNLFINVLGHSPNFPFSYRTYDTDDYSTNNNVLNFFTFGESLQNNHHYSQKNLNNAHKKGELDLTYYIIKYFFASSESLIRQEK